MLVMGSKLNEIIDELNEVLIKRRNILEMISPSVIFLIVNLLLGFIYAILVSIVFSFFFIVYKFIKKKPIKNSLIGFIGVLISGFVTLISGRLEGFFLSGIVTNFFIIILSILSLILRKPIASWASHLSRGWPLDWYWHRKVRPAYNEVTLFWILLLIVKLSVQIFFFRADNPNLFGIINIVTGWPLTIFILIVSYVSGQ
jgi:hypothetical protein